MNSSLPPRFYELGALKFQELCADLLAQDARYVDSQVYGRNGSPADDLAADVTRLAARRRSGGTHSFDPAGLAHPSAPTPSEPGGRTRIWGPPGRGLAESRVPLGARLFGNGMAPGAFRGPAWRLIRPGKTRVGIPGFSARLSAARQSRNRPSRATERTRTFS